jgi:putative hydrolase
VADDERNPERDFEELMRRLLGSGGDGTGFDPALLDSDQLEQLAQLGIDPAMIQTAMRRFQETYRNTDGRIDWDSAKRGALHIANQGDLGVSSQRRADLAEAFSLATLWLGEATVISELAEAPRSITRGAWVEATLPVWQELAEPVATSIADALTTVLAEQAPEEMKDVVQGASTFIRAIGGSLFAAQLGQVVGELSTEVISGGDVGIPLMPTGAAVILPQNFADFGRDLEVPEDQLALFAATRELAHARLFRHAKWLRLHVIAQVADYARGVRIDLAAMEDIASRFDPSEPDELRRALESGALMPPRTEEQTHALSRLENLLATIEGWVEVVTVDATSRIPSSDRIAEAVRRRRAVGGPAERALGSLVGLELRPRRIREAAAMWRAVTDDVGIAGRDSLWDYSDLMPTAEDIDDPSSLIARLSARARGENPVRDAMDEAIDALLADALGGDTGRDADGAAEAGPEASDGGAPGSDGHSPDADAPPEDPRPV